MNKNLLFPVDAKQYYHIGRVNWKLVRDYTSTQNYIAMMKRLKNLGVGVDLPAREHNCNNTGLLGLCSVCGCDNE